MTRTTLTPEKLAELAALGRHVADGCVFVSPAAVEQTKGLLRAR